MVIGAAVWQASAYINILGVSYIPVGAVKMLFVMMLNTIPGKTQEAIKLCKRPFIPEGVEIKMQLGLFGKPDILMIYEAPDEKSAAEFALQFASCTECTTHLATNMEDLRWMDVL